MKTFIKNLFSSLAVSAIVSVSALAENPTTGNDPTKNFEVGMYQTIRTSKLNLTIEKVKGQRLSVTLQNATGQVLYTEMVGKNSTKYWRKFDFGSMDSGVYQFQITNGETTITKEVKLRTPEAVEVQPEVLISVK